MTVILHEYNKTADPAVVAIAEQIVSSRKPWIDRAAEFAKRMTGRDDPAVYGGWVGNGWAVGAIGGPIADGNGKWKRSGNGWVPYKNNPLRKEFEALFWKVPTLPGVGHLAFCEASDGQDYFARPRPFLHEGVAYLRLPGKANVGDEASVWEEIKASEWYTAAEALDAKEKADD